jgi:hypothetical protein
MKYLDPPVFTYVGYVPNDTMWLPTVTICADEFNKFNNTFLANELAMDPKNFTDHMLHAARWSEGIAGGLPWSPAGSPSPLEKLWMNGTWKVEDLTKFDVIYPQPEGDQFVTSKAVYPCMNAGV